MTASQKQLTFGLLVLLLFVSSLGAAERTIPQPSIKDKCPVCGMFITKYPDWTSLIIFKNGSSTFFDGPKDMFKYLLDMGKYSRSKTLEQVAAFMVLDYYTLARIDGRKAWYVVGSDVFGPMGRELIPFEKEWDAKEFMRDHKGKRVLNGSEVTREVLKALDQ